MSWIGGSLSSLTGQLSNLTKDILTEGTEETSDHGTELRIAQDKIKDFQNVITTLNSENERLKQLNHDLEEKAESSELQINSISQQYRKLLEEKQEEVKKLKEEYNELVLHQSTTDLGHQKTKYGDYHHPSSPHGARDDLDFSDSINMQHEINQLRKENRKLQAQCDHLKSTSKSDVKAANENKYQKEIEDLQKKLKETSQQLSTEKENHQHEVASLQDLHSQKASILRKKFKDEISQYKQKIQELEDQISDVSARTDLQKGSDLESYEEKLKLLEHDHNQLKHDYEIVCKELKHAKNQLLDQLDSNHQRELNSEINDLEVEQDRVFSEADAMVTELRSKQQQKSTSSILDNLEKENLLLKQKNLELQEQIVILEKSVQTLTEEKSLYGISDGDDLQQQITSYQEEVQQFTAINSDLQSEKEALEGVLMELRGQLKEKEADLKEIQNEMVDKDFEFEELKKEKNKLEESLNESKLEMSQSEFVISTLTMEKEMLQKNLDDSELPHGGAADSLQEELTNKSRLLEELSIEKTQLETSLEELDAQHQEEINQVIIIRNKLSSKVESLQTEIQELSKTRDQLTEQNKEQKSQLIEVSDENQRLNATVESQLTQLDEVTKIRDQLTEEVKCQKMQIKELIEEKNECNEMLKEERLEGKKEEETVSRLQKDIEEKELEILELSKVKSENDKLLSQLDELQSQTEKFKTERDQLVQNLEEKSKLISSLETNIQERDNSIKSIEEKYHFVSEKLQQGSEAETSDFLQRINDLQNTLSEKDQLINNLKSETLDLSVAKNKLEEVVNKLKEEREVNDRKYNEMKEKFNNSALTINNLHMDIKELQENLAKAETNLDDKIQKIKQLREENSSFKQSLNDLKEENDSLKHSFEQLENDDKKSVLSHEIIKLKSDLQSKTNELMTLSDKYAELTKIDVEFSDYKQRTETEIKDMSQRLKDQNEEILSFKEEIAIQELELTERIKTLKTENLSLESTVQNLRQTLDEKVLYYENLIKDLQNGADLNETVTEKNKNLTKVNIEKDAIINSLTEEVERLKAMINEAEKLQESNSVDFIAKVQTISDLTQDISSLAAENEAFQSKIQEQMVLIEELRNTEEKFKHDAQILTSKIEMLAAEHATARETISKYQSQIKDFQNTIEDQKAGITQLNDKCQGHLQSLKEKESQVSKQEGILAVLHQASLEKDQQIDFLNKRMKKAVALIDQNKLGLLNMKDVPDYSLPALEYPEEGLLEQHEKTEVQEEMVKVLANEQESERDFQESESRDIIGEMENLQGLILQKDEVINELQVNNASLLKMLENKSTSNNDKTVVDVHRLENEVRNLKIEREQIMAVMNEKSREASSLKSEVHRLMNVVAAEKSAIDKLQKDMIQGGSGPDDKEDMQKQALQNLSRLVRDKDLEIESLKQKNETLLAVLQDSSNNGTEISTLMQDKENLTRQLKVFQDERDQMVMFVNQKHEESLKYHQEVQRLTVYINTEMEKHKHVQHDYDKLVPQFEDKKQALLKAQNELINYKQKYTELEVKYGEMVQKVNTSDTVDITSYNSQSEELKHAREKLKELSDRMNETEQKVSTLHQQNIDYEEELARRDGEIHSMRKQIDTLTFQLQGAEGELSDLRQEQSVSEKETSEQVSHLQMLKESNNRLTLELQDREFEIKSLQEKIQTLTSVVEGQKDEEGQVNKLLRENESVMAQVKELQQERHQTIMALKQRQIENQELQREYQKLKDKEMKYVKELERLRGHLLQMEEAYTKDALESEEREKDLRNRLAVAEEKVLSSTSAVQSASQQAVQQVESLQQQLYNVASQRDQAYLQLSSLQDQCQQYSVSLSNLQLVLEQFQTDKEGQVASEVEKFQRENDRLKKSVTELSTELSTVKEKLSEAEDGLEAASRLHQQLDKCDQTIAALKEEVQIREASLKNAEVEISDLRNAKDSKVDKMIIKSMFLGYFTAPKNKQDDVLHTIGSVLNFSPDEFEKVMGTKGKVGWIPGFLRFGGAAATPPTTPTRRHTVTASDTPDRSFSELFVKFLETESSPKQPIMKLPAEEMALDVQRHHKPVFNPFTAPRHVSHDGHSSRDEQHLLMASSPVSSTFPVFSTAARPTTPKTSSAILDNVLKSS